MAIIFCALCRADIHEAVELSAVYLVNAQQIAGRGDSFTRNLSLRDKLLSLIATIVDLSDFIFVHC